MYTGRLLELILEVAAEALVPKASQLSKVRPFDHSIAQ